MILHELKHRIDGTVRAVLFVLTLCVSATVFAAGLGFGPGDPARIGQGSSVGPGFAPMQRGGAAQSEPAAWAAPAGYRVALRKGDFVMADATHASQWNDSGGGSRHATQTTGVNQPVITADGGATFVDNDFFVLPQGSVHDGDPAQQPFTLVVRLKWNTFTAGNQVLLCSNPYTVHNNYSFGDGGNGWRIANTGNGIVYPTAGNAYPTIGTDSLFISSSGSAAAGSAYVYRTSGASVSCGIYSVWFDDTSWSLGNYEPTGTWQFAGVVYDVWIYPRELTADEIASFRQWFADNPI